MRAIMKLMNELRIQGLKGTELALSSVLYDSIVTIQDWSKGSHQCSPYCCQHGYRLSVPEHLFPDHEEFQTCLPTAMLKNTSNWQPRLSMGSVCPHCSVESCSGDSTLFFPKKHDNPPELWKARNNCMFPTTEKQVNLQSQGCLCGFVRKAG